MDDEVVFSTDTTGWSIERYPSVSSILYARILAYLHVCRQSGIDNYLLLSSLRPRDINGTAYTHRYGANTSMYGLTEAAEVVPGVDG
jgi:hypothetical protein